MFSEVVCSMFTVFCSFASIAHFRYIAACAAIWMQRRTDSWGDIWFVDINAVTFQYFDFCSRVPCFVSRLTAALLCFKLTADADKNYTQQQAFDCGKYTLHI